LSREKRLTASGSVEEIVTVTTLVTKTCTPCRGGIPPLTVDEVAVFRKQVPDWSIHDEGRRIDRTYPFKNFAGAFAFVRKVAEMAEAEGHHPNISFGWGYATVSLQTKKIQGLHENDFIMAAKFDDLADNIALGP
jgi:4a-hydroxytetrahydrobiopterin dehydratase